MLNVLKCLYNSRKAWVAGVTVLLTAVLTVWLAPLLNLTPEQATTIAVAIVAGGVAVIGGIAYEDGKLKEGMVIDEEEDE